MPHRNPILPLVLLMFVTASPACSEDGPPTTIQRSQFLESERSIYFARDAERHGDTLNAVEQYTTTVSLIEAGAPRGLNLSSSASPEKWVSIGCTVLPSSADRQERVDRGIAVAQSDDRSRWAPSPDTVAAFKKDAASPAMRVLDDGTSDIALGASARPPTPPQPPGLVNGDDAVRYGVAAWEQMARGDLRVKRIQY